MKHWPKKPLGEIADLYGGSTPSRDNPMFWNGNIHWVTPTDLPPSDEGISVVIKTKDQITQAGLDNSSAKIVPQGTVLLSSRATIGKVAVAGMPLTTNQGFANFIPHSEIIPRFLAYSLWFRRKDIARLSGSTTFKEVSRSTLSKYLLPVPPLAEQERIVKILDEADDLRKLRAQADRRTADLIPAIFHEMFGDSATNPKGWPTKPLGEIAEIFGGSTPSRDNQAFWGGDIPWVTPTDLPMSQEGVSVVTITKDYITKAGLDNSSARVVPKGTVLFSSRATIGKVAIADMPLATNQGFANLVPRSEVSNCFLAYSLWHCREDIARLSSSTTFKEVSRGTLRKYQIPVPPLPLQNEFARHVAEIRELEAEQTASRTRINNLFQSLLHRAFEGEL